MEASRTLLRPALGDPVFDRLVRTQRAPLERYVRGLGASREDAEEIAATALLRAYQSPPAAHRDSEWRAWLSTVARNLWIDARRRRELRLVTADDVLESVASDAASVDQIASAAEEARQICAAIALLPRAQRAAIYLREVRGLSYEEIAAQLGITIMAATAIVQRARGNVKQRRGGLSGGLAGLAFSPLALVRRGARLARSGSAYGAAVKVAVPVALMAGAGGAVAMAQHRASAARPQAPAAITRSSSVGASLTAKRNPLTAVVPLAIRRPAPPLRSPLRDVPRAQQLGAPLAASSAPAEAATGKAGAPGTAPIPVTADVTQTGHAANPAGARKQDARKAAAQHARNPPTHTRGSAPARPRGPGTKGAAARPGATSSHSGTAAQGNHASVVLAAKAAPATSGSAHRANAAPAAPPSTTPAGGAAQQSPASAGTSAPTAAAAAAPGGTPAAPTPPQAAAAESQKPDGSPAAHGPG